jgi:hypothetical protein
MGKSKLNKKVYQQHQCVLCLWITTEGALLYRLSVSLWNAVLSSGRNNDSGTAWRHIYIKHPCSQNNNVIFSLLFSVYNHVHPHNNLSPLNTIKQSSLPPAESLSLSLYLLTVLQGLSQLEQRCRTHCEVHSSAQCTVRGHVRCAGNTCAVVRVNISAELTVATALITLCVEQAGQSCCLITQNSVK